MVVRFDIRTKPIHENNVISRYRDRVSRRRLGQLEWNRTNLAKLYEDWGFKVQEHRRSQKLQAGPSTMGIMPTFSNNKEKGLGVGKLQVIKAYWADAPCAIHPFRKCTSGRSFALRRHTWALKHFKGPQNVPASTTQSLQKDCMSDNQLLGKFEHRWDKAWQVFHIGVTIQEGTESKCNDAHSCVKATTRDQSSGRVVRQEARTRSSCQV